MGDFHYLLIQNHLDSFSTDYSVLFLRSGALLKKSPDYKAACSFVGRGLSSC